jgi:four helix bundle protein
MSRDFRKLRTFQLADELKRAAVSAPANIVEGSARRTTREYLNFVDIAAGSAAEARYLVDLSRRLGFIKEAEASSLLSRYVELSAKLQALQRSLAAES